MNTLESCVAECPIVQGLPEARRAELLVAHRQMCLQRRLGQLGVLCGETDAVAKNQLTQVVLAIPNRNDLLIPV